MTGEPTVNIPLLRKVMDHITAHPEEHDQESWAIRRDCGTTMCVAGWTVHFAGHVIDWSEDDSESCTVDGNRALISDTAQADLGIGAGAVEDLFFQSVTLDDVWQTVERITDGEITRPAP
jgi:hypothetical protein